MGVVQIRRVRVIVLPSVVSMDIAVLSLGGRVVTEVVVTVVVPMCMFVFDRLVFVLVPVGFGEVEVHAEAEEPRSRPGCGTCTAVSHRPRDGGPYERGNGEDGPRSTGADPPLRQEIEAQTEAVSRGSAREEAQANQGAWELLPCRQGNADPGDGAERSLPSNDLRRVEVGEGAGERVVERPTKSR